MNSCSCCLFVRLFEAECTCERNFQAGTHCLHLSTSTRAACERLRFDAPLACEKVKIPVNLSVSMNVLPKYLDEFGSYLKLQI